MFDKVEIIVRSGSGGDGAISFRREKFVPFGGPDGGKGGDGGSVIITADPSVTSLRGFRSKRLYKAGNGSDGKGKNQYGENGKDLALKVPVGTIILEKTTGGVTALADLGQDGQQIIVAEGGRGGWGNVRFASPTNQTPRIAQKGEGGEEKSIVLEMRLIADVGIIGFPNVGKSTFLAAASAAKPKIADYPFTTLEPVLGVAEAGQDTMVLAEIPGLVAGAHLGRGLGHDFLRHAMRTKMFIHLIDGSSASPVEDMIKVNGELSLFDPLLGARSQLVVVNKIDLPEVQARLPEIREAFNQVGTRVFFASAVTREGMVEVLAEAKKRLQPMATGKETAVAVPVKVFRPRPQPNLSIRKEDGTFIVVSPELERIVARVDMAGPEVRRQVNRQLMKLAGKTLERAGIRPGDKIRCGSFEWEW
ncbi:MAG: GTPase ObgE [Chloroflexota bacterium]